MRSAISYNGPEAHPLSHASSKASAPKIETLVLEALVGTSHRSAAQVASHSCTLSALRARKLIPSVPKAPALLDCGAPLKTSALQDTLSTSNNAYLSLTCALLCYNI